MEPRGRPGDRPVRIAVTATAHREERARALAGALPALVGTGSEAEARTLGPGFGSLEGICAVVILLDSRDVPHGLSDLLDAAEEELRVRPVEGLVLPALARAVLALHPARQGEQE